MDLKEYLYSNLIDPREFAKENRISITSIYRYLNGGKCHRARAFLIEKITKGNVSAKEMMENDK